MNDDNKKKRFSHLNKAFLAHGLSNDEVVRVFETVLFGQVRHVAISKGSLKEKIDQRRKDLSALFLSPIKKVAGSVEPANLQAAMLKVWQDFFEVELDVLSDFFGLGGDSISAIELADSIKLKLGVDVSPYVILEKKNVDSLVAFLGASQAEYEVNFIPLQIYANKSALICIHPGHGAITQYRDLFSRIEVPLSIYAVENDVLHGKPFKTINEMAAFYAEQLTKEIDVSSGLLLAGWSLGGTVAHAMVNMLLKRGITVTHLALFDPWALYTPRLKQREFFNALQKNMVEGSQDWLDALWHYTQCLLAHKPALVDVDTSLFKAKQLREEYVDMQDGYNHWQAFLNNDIEVIDIEGDHQTMMQPPNIDYFAQEYQAVLRRVIQNSSK